MHYQNVSGGPTIIVLHIRVSGLLKHSDDNCLGQKAPNRKIHTVTGPDEYMYCHALCNETGRLKDYCVQFSGECTSNWIPLLPSI